MSVDKDIADSLIKDAISNRKRILGLESMGILSSYGIRVVDSRIVKTLPEAVRVSEEIGYPVVMKIVSPTYPIRPMWEAYALICSMRMMSNVLIILWCLMSIVLCPRQG